MNDQEWVDLNVAGLAAFYRAIGASNPNAQEIDRDGFYALKTPAAPERSLVNAVIYKDGEALVAAIPELTEFYAADACAWTVWSPATDVQIADKLQEAGHVLDSNPEAMAIELDDYPEPDMSGIEWTDDADFERVCVVNALAYDLPPDSFTRGFGLEPPEGARLYSASLTGETVAASVTYDHPRPDGGTDSTFWLVATLAKARGKGLGGALMKRGLWDAAQRGCSSSILQATKMGQPLYEKLGYKGYGALNMWELRASEGDGH